MGSGTPTSRNHKRDIRLWEGDDCSTGATGVQIRTTACFVVASRGMVQIRSKVFGGFPSDDWSLNGHALVQVWAHPPLISRRARVQHALPVPRRDASLRGDLVGTLAPLGALSRVEGVDDVVAGTGHAAAGREAGRPVTIAVGRSPLR